MVWRSSPIGAIDDSLAASRRSRQVINDHQQALSRIILRDFMLP
jgi:hypothetical protein